MHEWNKFPFDNQAYDYQGETLREIWHALHAGDREPFPQNERLQEAWRCYHRGDFQQAVNLADECGLQAHVVANKATGMYASYLEKNQKRQMDCYKSAIVRAEKAIIEFPDEANSHHFYAFNLVLPQCDNYGFRGSQMFQDKAQTAKNGPGPSSGL